MQLPTVKLTGAGSYMQVDPVVWPLLEHLRFYLMRTKLVPLTDREGKPRLDAKGKPIVRRDGYEGKYEQLYSLNPEQVAFGEPQTLVTYRGLRVFIEGKLRELGYQTTFNRLWPKFTPHEPLEGESYLQWALWGLRPEQLQFVLAMLLAGQEYGGAMGEGATGVGKTHIIAALVKAHWRFAQKILLVTDSRSVVQSLFKELSELFKGTPILPGITQGSNVMPQKFTISTVKMMDHHDPDLTDVIIYDECHGAAANEASQLLLAFQKALRYGLSGTITDRSDNKEIYLESIFGPIVANITDQEAEALGRVSKQIVYVMEVPDGPDVSGANEYQQEKHGIWYNDARNKIIQDFVRMAPPDQQLLIFVRTTEHLEELTTNWLSPDFVAMHAELPAKQQVDIQDRFVKGEIKRLIATDCIKQGVNTKNLFILVNANWTTSRVGVGQRRGRNRRNAEGKDFGVILEFDDAWMTRAQTAHHALLEGMVKPVGENDVDDRKDPLKRRANKRISRYSKAGDTIQRIKSLSEIQFNPIHASQKTDTDSVSGELPLH